MAKIVILELSLPTNKKNIKKKKDGVAV